MVMTSSRFSSSSLSSIASSNSSEDAARAGGTVKFLCSYGGRILPRFPDGKLRYVGGETRVVAVDRNVSFEELVVKMGEVSGYEVAKLTLRCQIPSEDLDTLVTITSDEDLTNLIEEYDLANRDRPSPLKIRVFLTPIQSPSPPISTSSTPSPSSVKANSGTSYRRIPLPCHHHQYKPQHPHLNHNQCHASPANAMSYKYHPNQVHSGNHWQ